MHEMRRFQMIAEGREAPLYHSATYEKAQTLFQSDMVAASWNHDLSHLGLGKVDGTSLTRNRRYWYPTTRWAFLTFDQARLTQRYRVVPLDGDHAFSTGRFRDRANSTGAAHGTQLAEEFLIGDVVNAHRYLRHVLVHLPETYEEDEFEIEDARELRALAEAWGRKFNVPVELTPEMQAIW